MCFLIYNLDQTQHLSKTNSRYTKPTQYKEKLKNFFMESWSKNTRQSWRHQILTRTWKGDWLITTDLNWSLELKEVRLLKKNLSRHAAKLSDLRLVEHDLFGSRLRVSVIQQTTNDVVENGRVHASLPLLRHSKDHTRSKLNNTNRSFYLTKVSIFRT